MHSHHSHSGQFCAHAKSTLDQVLHEAYAQGFTTYGLSEHVPRSRECDLYLEEREAGLGPVELHRRFESYLSEARKAQTEWEGRMHLLVGCETENTHSPGSMDELIALLDRGGRAVDSDDSFRSDRRAAEEVGRGKVDYIVGSVHHAHEIPIDFDKPTFERALAVCGGEPSTTPEGEEDAHRALMRSYLDLQYEVMQRLRPEVIGHFDLCRLFRPAGRFRRADAAKQDAQEDEVWTRVVRNVRYAAKYGALFEVNAAAFRKGWDEAYPGREVLDLIVSVGGRLCLSDDSHGLQAVGLNYGRMRTYLLSAGVQEIWYLERLSSSSSHHPSSTHPSSTSLASDIPNKSNDPQEGGADSKVGLRAPTVFARGTRAVKVSSGWADDGFWERTHPST